MKVRMKVRALARGQTMVLFALTILLTTLLVLMTLSISTRVKEKMELQAVADAAAYSNAVVTARAYNEIALMSRGQIGKMVSMAGVQSLISWSSYYRAQVEATRRSYNMAKIPYQILQLCCIPGSGCSSFCRCARRAVRDINNTRRQLSLHQAQLEARWMNLDRAAADQVRNLQGMASVLYGAQLERYIRLQTRLDGQDVAKDIVNRARAGSRWPGEWSAPGSGDDVAVDEAVGLPILAGAGGAALPINPTNRHHLYAGMGSRGFSFTTMRTMGGPVITAQLMRQITPPDTVLVTNRGSAYFADRMNHGRLFPGGEYSWADDHAQGIANLTTFNRGQPPCPPTTFGISNARAHVRTTDSRDQTDRHIWSPGGRFEEVQRHTLGSCLRCPGIWPTFVDYNPAHLVTGSGNLWGQPKNHAVIQRNYSARTGSPDPWALNFRFNFTNSGASAQSGFDNRGIRLSPQNGSLDISRQTALSTGIAYYHRHDHWKEPPNLLNPYWRATLVPFDVDDDGASDVRKTLRDVGAGWAADAFQALENNGYKGGP